MIIRLTQDDFDSGNTACTGLNCHTVNHFFQLYEPYILYLKCLWVPYHYIEKCIGLTQAYCINKKKNLCFSYPRPNL